MLKQRDCRLWMANSVPAFYPAAEEVAREMCFARLAPGERDQDTRGPLGLFRRRGAPSEDHGRRVLVDESPPPAAGSGDGDNAAEKPAEAASAEAIGGEAAGWRWVNWVRAGLRDGSIVANAASGWLHNIAGEAYVVVPDGFEAVAAQDGVSATTVKNRVARLGRHRERSTRSGAANTFRAELPDGRRVDGMVFPGDLIWESEPPPEATGSLGRRRR